MTEHVEEDLLPLLTGELDRATTAVGRRAPPEL